MEPRRELLVFNKKEVFIILSLLVLVSLFSFTLGVRLGKNLAQSKAAHSDEHSDEHGPLAADHGEDHHGSKAIKSDESHAKTDHAHSAGHDTEELKGETTVGLGERSANHGASSHSDAGAVEEEESPHKQAAKTKADIALDKELTETNAGLGKTIPMGYPGAKKGLKPNTHGASQDHHDALHGTTHGNSKLEKAVAGKFTLQVGSHRTEKEAIDQVSELKKGGLDAFSIEVNLPGKGVWYRVGVGMFPSKENAEKTAYNWKRSKGLPAYIIQRVDER